MKTEFRNYAKLVIPCHWDKTVLDKIIASNKIGSNTEVVEVYGVLQKGPVGHGRTPGAVPYISAIEAEGFCRYVHSFGLKFAYLLNAPFDFKSKEHEAEVRRYIEWIVERFGADSLVIASTELMGLVREMYPNIPLCISTIAGVLTIDQLERFLEFNPTRVVLHHDANRNFSDLSLVVQRAEKLKVEVEVMVTESCLRKCSNRAAHYAYLGGGNIDTGFHTVCGRERMFYPREFLKANIIRPEDLEIYESMGICLFKITGRSKLAEWLPEVVEAYLKRKYSGNLIRLVGIDPSLKAEDLVYIDNKSLNGFLAGFPKTNNEKDENGYCDYWIRQLYDSGKFCVQDGSRYLVNGEGELFCEHPGTRVSEIVS